MQSARFLLLGDSHASPIGKAAQLRGIPFCGGPLGAGRDFYADFFDISDGDIIFRKSKMNNLYRKFLAELGASGLSRITVPLVATIGFSIHFFATVENWDCYHVRKGELEESFLSSKLFDSIIGAMARDALGFYEHALAMKLRVFGIMPPQRVPSLSHPVIFMAAQETMRRKLNDLGVEIIDVRPQVTNDHGFQRPEFCEADDPLHGNVEFGRLILEELIRQGV